MADDISVKLAVEGEQNFKTAISAANAQLKAMDAELQAAVSSMTGMESAEQKLAAKSSILNQQIEKNKEKLSILSQQYEKSKAKLDELGQALEKAKAEHGDNSAEATKAANAYNRQAQEVAKLEKDIANTNTAINKETAELNQLNNTLAKTGEKWQEAGAKISDAGEKITSVGSTLTKTVTAPLVAAGTAAAKFASDYEENLNKVDASFKDNAAEVKAWAKTATQQFGMSESAALDATSTFGDMGTSMGLTTKEAADMSTSLAGLAGDLSSFKNIGIDQAMSALKGVFTGETEGLKSLGVVMTETNLKAFAEDMGLVYDSMSQAEKVTLRYQYVLANTTNAQGDYARTSDGTANSIRTLQAEASNLASAFGQELLPQVTPLIQKATELVRGFGELDEGTKQSVIQAGLLAAATGPVVTGLGKVTEGVGKAVETAGTLTKALSGGGGLASALTATLGTGGAVGLAVAGAAALTAGTVVLINKISEANDPVRQLKNSLSEMEEAQNRAGESESIISLADRYDLLRAKVSDTTLSDTELSAVEEELASVRQQLADATDGAVSSGEALTDVIDAQVKSEREIAEIERNHANTELYAKLIEGAEDYKEALLDQKRTQLELDEAMKQMDGTSEALVNGWEDAFDSLNKTIDDTKDKLAAGLIDTSTVEGAAELDAVLRGLEEVLYSLGYDVHFEGLADAEMYMSNLDVSTQGMARSTSDAADKVTELDLKIQKSKALTDGYKQSVIDLVNSGFIDAQKGADLLGVSVDAMGRMLTAAWTEEHKAAAETGALSDAQMDAIDSAERMAEAEKKAAEEFAQMVTDLEGLPDLLSATGYSSQELAIMLTEAGVSVDQFASGVGSMRDSVVNDFQLLSESQKTTADEMVAALQANLQAQQEWSGNLTQLWWDAYAEQDTAVMQYISYLADLGPEYASAVAEFANGGYSKLEEAAEAWAAIGDQSAKDYTSGIWMNNYLAEQAGADLGGAALAGMESVDQTTGAQGAVNQVVGTIESGQGAVESAMSSLGEGAAGAYENTKSVAEAAVGTVTSGMIEQIEGFYEDMKSAGAGLVTFLNAGIASKLSEARDVAESVAEAAKEAAGSVDFKPVGYNMAAGIASGFRSGRSGVVSAAVEVVNAAVRAAKQAAEIHSPSKVMEDEVGLQLTAGIARGMVNADALTAMEDSADTIIDIVSGKLSGLNDSIDAIELAQERRAQEKELREFEESMAELRQKYAEADLEERADIQKQIDEKQVDWDEKRLKEQETAQIESLKSQIEYLEEWQKAYEDAMAEYQDSYQDAYNGIMRQQETMASKMADFGDLFTYNDSGTSLRLGDLEQQTLAIEEYGEMLEQLQERGISGDLMQEILGLDIKDAWNYGSRLLGLSDASYEKYMESWAKKQETAAAIAERFYSDDLDALQAEYVDKIPEVLDSLKGQMGDLGTDSALALAEAFEAQKDTIADSFLATINAAYSRAAQSVSAPISGDYVTREDLYKATSGVVNGMSVAMAGTQVPTSVTIPMYINGTKFAEATLADIRAVSKANPEVVSDR